MATITFAGLASGIDFNQLVDAMIDVQREPVRQLEARKRILELRKELFDQIESSMSGLKSAVETLLDRTAMFATNATSSDTDLLTVESDSTAAASTYRVTVQNMATSTRVQSGFNTGTILGLGGKVTTTEEIAGSNSGIGVTVTAGYFTINGTQVTVNVDEDDPNNPATNDTLDAIISRINTQVSGVTASYDSATDKITLTSASAIVVGAQDDTSNFLTATSLLSSPDVLAGPDHTRTSQVHLGRVRGDVALASANFHTAITGDASGDGSFTINGVTVNYNVNDDSLNDVISRINANVTDVVASYDAITDRVLLTSRTTGSLALSRAAGTGNFLDVVGLLDSGTYAQASQTVGENAAVVIEGFNGGNPIYSTSNDLTSAIPGVTLHLKEENTSPVTVTVARDQNAFKNALKTFVERYNQVVEELHARLTEEQVENPTTELEERYGLLRGNQVVSRTRLDLVSKAIDRVTGLPGDLDQLTDLGITISSSDYLVGRLTLDEATLDEAMEDNLEGVYDVLFNDADNDNEVDTGETGMAVRLQDLLDDLLSTTQQLYGGASFSEGLLPRQGEQLQREIDRLDDRIDTLNDRLEVRATLLRQQFVAAEQAIAQLQGQSYGLVGFLGQG